ncbi:MAG TPA: nuclear transport factor 2 family protein [Thermoanaerobaculia bacterium]|nr:nuclear transport factor 2 family protein [Thermoanaerobaculia bacterium]
MSSALDTVRQLDEAFNRGDLEAVLSFYADDATVVLEPGRLAVGKEQLRETFRFVLTLGGKAEQLKTNVIENGDLALFTSEWTFTGADFQRRSFANTVLRRQVSGQWLVVIDNSWGPAILA